MLIRSTSTEGKKREERERKGKKKKKEGMERKGVVGSRRRS